MKVIDCRGLKCPAPVINTKKYFDAVESGEVEVIVDNEVAKNNISKFSQSNNFLFSVQEKEDLYYIKIEKKASKEISKTEENNLVIVITSDKLGSGDEGLGSTLMKSYLYALSEADKLPKDLLLLNSGVKLAAADSEVIDSLIKLKERGVYIACCGICLEFYGIKDKLKVGDITNMYTIIEKMNSASNTIKL